MTGNSAGFLKYDGNENSVRGLFGKWGVEKWGIFGGIFGYISDWNQCEMNIFEKMVGKKLLGLEHMLLQLLPVSQL